MDSMSVARVRTERWIPVIRYTAMEREKERDWDICLLKMEMQNEGRNYDDEESKNDSYILCIGTGGKQFRNPYG